MIRQLVEVNYLQNRDAPTPEQIVFWCRELRTPSLLLELAQARPQDMARFTPERAVLAVLPQGEDAIAAALHDEEMRERELDRAYWLPLKVELEQLRRQARTKNPSA